MNRERLAYLGAAWRFEVSKVRFQISDEFEWGDFFSHYVRWQKNERHKEYLFWSCLVKKSFEYTMVAVEVIMIA